MDPISITVRVGQQVEGLELDEVLRQKLFDDLDEHQVVDAMLQSVRNLITWTVAVEDGSTLTTADHFVNGHIRTIH